MKKIKCNNCGHEFIISDEDLSTLSVCPRCGIQLYKEESISFDKPDTLGKALFTALSAMGLQAFDTPSRIIGYMLDSAPEISRDINIFAKNITGDYLKMTYQAFGQDRSEAKQTIRRLHGLLMTNEGLSQDWADKLCYGITEAISYYTEGHIRKISNAVVMDEVVTDDVFIASGFMDALHQEMKKSRNHNDIEKQKRDHDKLTQKAESGDVRAMIQLGDAALEDYDNCKALEWYKQAADKGSAYAKNKYIMTKAKAHFFGYGFQKDYKEALYWFNKIPEDFLDGETLRCMGDIYFLGHDGVKKDHKKAMNYYEQAAAKGDKAAATLLYSIK